MSKLITQSLPFIFLYFNLLLHIPEFKPFYFGICTPDTKTIYGEVINSTDKTSIPYATIIHSSRKKGFNTNVDGLFVFEWNGENDTLHISSVGYFDTLYVLSKETYQSTIKIKLRQKTIELEEYNFIYKTEKSNYYTTPKSKCSGYFGGMSDKSTEFGLSFSEPKICGKHLISVYFYVAKAGRIKTPFRVRVYDLREKTPDKELTTSNIFVTATQSGWNEFNVSSQNITISENGCLVAMEWINISNEYSIYDKNMKESVYGQKLGLSYVGNIHRGFLRDNRGPWFSFESIVPKSMINNEKTYFLNPMIRITVN